MIWPHARAGCNFHHGSLKNGWSRETVEVATLKVSNANIHNHSSHDTIWSKCVFVPCYYGLDIKKPVDQLGWSTLEPGASGLHHPRLKWKQHAVIRVPHFQKKIGTQRQSVCGTVGRLNTPKGSSLQVGDDSSWRRWYRVVPKGHFWRFWTLQSASTIWKTCMFLHTLLLVQLQWKKTWYSVTRSSVSMLEVL